MIEAEALTKDFGTIRAVDSVSFTVRKGDILGFLGPNGAGKSTTMKMLTGFLTPTSGTGRIGGHDIRREPLAAKRLFGYLPENGPLYPEMTVLEFLNFVSDLRLGRNAKGKASKIGKVIEICHLDGVLHQPIETLSKGYRQRVGMAHTVLHDPPYLIMDEPTDGLDPNQKQEVRRLIASMAEEKAIILSTHILEEVESMCTRIIIIDKGAIRVDETPDELRRRHPRYNAIQFGIGDGVEADGVRSELAALSGVKEVTVDDRKFVVVPEGESSLEEPILRLARERGWPLSSFGRVPVGLEEVFWDVTQ